MNNNNDLQTQHDKIKAMLNNPHLQLPDGGAKLKAKLAQLEGQLKNSLSDKVSGLSLNEKVNVRQQTLTRSNQTPISTNLLRAHSKDTAIDQTQMRVARMMSLEESMKLQESQQKDIQLANMRKRMEEVTKSNKSQQESLADDLSVTMNRLRLDPESRQPIPDDDDDDDDDDDESDDDDDDLLETEEEDEGFEEDDDDDESESEQQQQ